MMALSMTTPCILCKPRPTQYAQAFFIGYYVKSFCVWMENGAAIVRYDDSLTC